MCKFFCPKCGKSFSMKYWTWVFRSPFHWFNFKQWKDYRKTRCPHCGEKSWIKRTK